ncbi:MAG: signal peptidase I [Spirochaetaceae bacterium]
MAEQGLSRHRRKRRQQRTRRLLGFLALFLISYLLITTVLLETIRVRDSSMAPTLQKGDLLLVSPLLHRVTRLRRVERGDLVLLENPARPVATLGGHLTRRFVHFFSFGKVQGATAAGSPLLLRRVMALPGERLLLDGYRFYLRSEEGRWVSEIQLFPEGYEPLLPERVEGRIPWPSTKLPGSPDAPALTVPPERYYFAADNRGGAMDSRIWGPVAVDRLRGAVLLRLLPLSRFGPLNEAE